jgi:O-antigen ligase
VARKKHSFDAAALLTIWVFAVMLIPANLVVKPLGSAGTPGQLLGLLALGWWLSFQLDRPRATLSPPQPVRRAMLVFVVANLISYVVAATRPIEALELSAADRGLLLVFSWLGIVLLTSDGVPTLARLDTVLRRLALTGGIAATLGVAQFFTGMAFIDKIQIPGLSPNNDLNSVYARNGFARAAGTSTHPIEFGVVLTMILPIALHYAFTDTHRGRFSRWFPVAAIAVAVPVTLSRSALIGVVVVFAVLMPSWTARRRHFAAAATGTLLLTVYLAVPGLLGTMIRLFTGISNDDSARSRTDSYTLAWHFISHSPVFGRGVSTFLPMYRILDNQYLGLVIETGIVGLVTFIILIVTGIRVAAKLRKTSTDPAVSSLALALIATVAAAACAYATFDAFGFPQVAGLTFFALGCISALRGATIRAARAQRSAELLAQDLSSVDDPSTSSRAADLWTAEPERSTSLSSVAPQNAIEGTSR